MASVAAPGGWVQVLDYDHTLATWQPDVPESVRHLYNEFLRWRSDLGFDNRMGQRLADLLRDSDVEQVETETCEWTWERSSADGWNSALIWADVAASSRGHQLVADGYLTESARADAEHAYRHWHAEEGIAHRVHLVSAHGRVPGSATS